MTHQLLKSTSMPTTFMDEGLLSVNAHQLNRDRRYIVNGLLMAGQVSMLCGAPNTGKSAVIAAVAAHVAKGRDFAGYRTCRAAVLYVAAEDPNGIADRAHPCLNAGMTTARPFNIFPLPINLCSENTIDQFIDELIAYQMAAQCERLLVVIDPFNLCIGEGDENSARDMGRAIGNAQRVARETGAHVMIIHHTAGHDGNRQRGSTAMEGNVDTLLTLHRAGEKQPDGVVFIAQRKQSAGLAAALRPARALDTRHSTPRRPVPDRRGRRAEGPDRGRCLGLLEADFLDATKSGVLGAGRLVQGIEFDPLGKRRAYWLHAEHPGDAYGALQNGLESRPVPATEIAHVYEKQRTQARGVAWGAPVIRSLRDLDDYEVAELVRKKTEACVTAIVFGDDEAQRGIAPSVVDADGNRVEQFEPGLIAYARGGKDIRFNQPSATGGYGEYKRASLHTISAGFRVPYEVLTGDLSQVNYSSIRAGRMGPHRIADRDLQNQRD